MGYRETEEALGILNDELVKRNDGGELVTMDVVGRPKLHIESFEPLIYERYGALRNRPPQVDDSVVLRAFLDAPTSYGGTSIYAGVEAGSDAYGFALNTQNPRHRGVIDEIAQLLGHPDIKI